LIGRRWRAAHEGLRHVAKAGRCDQSGIRSARGASGHEASARRPTPAKRLPRNAATDSTADLRRRNDGECFGCGQAAAKRQQGPFIGHGQTRDNQAGDHRDIHAIVECVLRSNQIFVSHNATISTSRKFAM
jgi:hypothetical protein